ncbi:hypothetical protein GCM10010971_12880 [Silvimonas amylolytica]|uniref:Uncharacterized protein n=2 Tax=Silvimonas amylolytica TaxID=449663 RepID=A0ABQ2PKF9_9NEIS|nr:hypothetical protein GCM10010971_12880 [Silvimonas amylolytica]
MIMLASTTAFATANETGFANRTEDSTHGWPHISPNMATVLAQQWQGENRSEWTGDADIEGQLRRSLVWHALPVGHGQPPVYFVRPVLNPDARDFYGAHAFMHWLIWQNKIVLSRSDDAIRVLAGHSHGLPDIEEQDCMGGRCWLSTWQYDGQAYQDRACHMVEIATHQELGTCK